MDPKQLEQTVVQVLQTNTLNTLPIGTGSHASDAESKDTYAHHASPQMCTAPHCRTPNHSTKACRRYNSNNNSPPNSNSNQGYHPTPSPTQTDTNRLFAPTKTSTAVQSPIPNTIGHSDTATSRQ